jgi:hypothetical protein
LFEQGLVFLEVQDLACCLKSDSFHFSISKEQKSTIPVDQIENRHAFESQPWLLEIPFGP